MTKPSTRARNKTIIKRAKAGEAPKDIALSLSITVWCVYKSLERMRDNGETDLRLRA